MKKISSLPKGCELSVNVTIYKHTPLKLNKPTLIIGEKDNLKEIVYYISFSSCKDKTNTNSMEEIIYYDETGCGFLSEFYYLRDREFLFQTRFKQIQEGVIYLEGNYTYWVKILSYLESEGEIFMRGRVNFKRQKCSFLVMTTFLDFQGFQGKEKQNDCSIKLWER